MQNLCVHSPALISKNLASCKANQVWLNLRDTSCPPSIPASNSFTNPTLPPYPINLFYPIQLFCPIQIFYPILLFYQHFYPIQHVYPILLFYHVQHFYPILLFYHVKLVFPIQL